MTDVVSWPPPPGEVSSGVSRKPDDGRGPSLSTLPLRGERPPSPLVPVIASLRERPFAPDRSAVFRRHVGMPPYGAAIRSLVSYELRTQLALAVAL